MLKRQRPATPPPSSLDDSPMFLPDGPIRPLQPSDPTQPRYKRQRILPPPLDGTLRGWLYASHRESDGEEDWTEDAYDASSPPLPASTTGDHYKDANSRLHELHVLNQHRLLFAHPPPPRDYRLNPNSGVAPHAAHTLTQHVPAEQGPATWPEGPLYHPTPPHLEGRNLITTKEKGLVEEVQCVRQRYEDANRCAFFILAAGITLTRVLDCLVHYFFHADVLWKRWPLSSVDITDPPT